jgi:hypothetical protein
MSSSDEDELAQMRREREARLGSAGLTVASNDQRNYLEILKPFCYGLPSRILKSCESNSIIFTAAATISF